MEEGGWLLCEAGNTTFRSPQKATQSLVPVFLEHAKLKLGNGRRIKFQGNAWGESEPFKTKYLNLFRLSLMHNKLFLYFLDNPNNPEPSQNLYFWRCVSEKDVVELADLLSTLEKVRVCGVLKYKQEWKKEGSRIFTCKSLFKSLIDKPTYTSFKFHHFIWKISIPNKVRVFDWLLILKKLNTQDLLQKKKETIFVYFSELVCYVQK